MKKNFKHLLLAATALLAVTSCGKDDPEIPDQPGVENPSKPAQDPVGTVTVNMHTGHDIRLGPYLSVRINYNNNLDAGFDEIVSVGPVAGLGNITEIPSIGWKQETAVTPGEGYVLRSTNANQYARLYVVEYIESSTGEIIGAKVKYECPFIP